MRNGLLRATPEYMLLVALALAGCRDGGNGGGSGRTPPPPPGTSSCPGSGLTICDMKLDSSTEHPALESPVTMENVVVTTATMTVSRNTMTNEVTLAGFFVQDQETSDALKGQYSGMFVTYDPRILGDRAPVQNAVVSVTGVFTEFGREGFAKQRQVKATDIVTTGSGAVVPVEIESPALIATGGEKAAAYEGVVVKVNELTISETTVMVNGAELFGAFRVDSSLIISTQLYRYTNPQVNEQFTSIAGVLRLGTAPFDAGEYLLTPRFMNDVLPKNAAAVVSSIRDIQDATAPGHPTEGCANLTGQETVGKCARARLTNVVVTAAGGYVSTNLRSIFVQDDTITDGRFAGIMVVYNRNSAPFVPQAGDRVNVEGEIIDFRRGTQIQFPTIEKNGTETKILDPIVVQPTDVARTLPPEMNPYEGVLVKVENVTVTTACFEDDRGRDHGNFELTGGVYIGTAFDLTYNGDFRPASVQCLTPEGEPTGLCGCDAHSFPNDQRMAGDAFRSVAGVVNFAFDNLQLNPRSDADLVR